MDFMFVLGMLSTWEIVLIVIGFLILFGGKKIPGLMKGIGQGMTEFKKARKEAEEDNKETEAKEEKK